MNWTFADVLTTGGILAIAGGAAWVYPPAGLIVLGVLAAGIGIAVDIAASRGEKKNRDR